MDSATMSYPPIYKRDTLGRIEASRVFRRLLNVRRSLHYEQDIEQIFA
jgi:hypothetical protein